jgi:hypothetical protein
MVWELLLVVGVLCCGVADVEVCTYHVQQPPAPHFFCFPRGDFIRPRLGLYFSISRMWPTSIILSAAVILAASSVSASNDPRECEGEIPMPTQRFRSSPKLSIG